ncbi:hypothetical protein HKX48_002922 [Thoreauomyces humboldtii]|nr:hypothetical protein HKX48_002922 [Thoreauomyces humboldtii]
MQWVPFTLLGECVNHYGENPGEHINAASPLSDGQGYTNVPIDDEHEESDGASTAPSTLVNPNATNQRGVAPPAHAHLDAGMVLGIHNIYIVLPQFFATFMCSVTFTLFGFLERRAPAGTSDTGPSVPDGANAPPPPTEAWQDPYDATGWVLRLGAISCIVAGVLALRVQEVHSPTKKKGRVIIAAGH